MTIKLLKFILTLICFPSLLMSQNKWIYSTGGQGNDETMSSVKDNNGNYYAAGYYTLHSYFGNDDFISKGSDDIFITKYSSSGQIDWNFTAGGAFSDRPYAIATYAGYVYICGIFTGTVTFDTTVITSNGNNPDIFIASLDSNGVLQWVKNFGGIDIEIPEEISVDQSGIYVAGRFRGVFNAGSQQFSSLPDSTGVKGYDFFLFKLDQAGNLLNGLQGGSSSNDRINGMVKQNDHIYISGVYSDTLFLNGSFPSAGFNRQFVLSLDTTGQVEWISTLTAPFAEVKNLIFHDNKIYCSVNFVSSMKVTTSSGITQINNPYTNSAGVVVFSTSGIYINSGWVGSDNEILIKSMDVQGSGIYIAGDFECSLTSLQDSAVALFESAGFHDLFIVEMDSAFGIVRYKQAGGPGDDKVVSVISYDPDQVYLSGSFDDKISFNGSQNTGGNAYIYNMPGTASNYCGVSNYNSFLTATSSGFRDAFSSVAIDWNSAGYDFYKRTWGCNLNPVAANLFNSMDTINGCDSINIFTFLPTDPGSIVGPRYSYLWSNGSTDAAIMASTTGYYAVTVTPDGGCTSYYDSVYVQIYFRANPGIEAVNVFMKDALPVNSCYRKGLIVDPDTALLIGTNVPAGYQAGWVIPGGSVIANDSIYITEPGLYSFIVSSPGNVCYSSVCLELMEYVVNGTIGQCLPADTLIICPLNQPKDTIGVCKGDTIQFYLTIDSLKFLNSTIPLPLFGDWEISGPAHFLPGLTNTTFMMHEQRIIADGSGYCSIKVWVYDSVGLGILIPVTFSFYLESYNYPLDIFTYTAPQYICPGREENIVFTGADSITVIGSAITYTSLNMDTVTIDNAGIVSGFYWIMDTVHGCHTTDDYLINVAPIPSPVITPFPDDRIACPDDSIQLNADAGSAYEWYGPLGLLDTTSIIYINTAGNYYYSFVDTSGCSLVSESIEILEYSAPYLTTVGQQVLCPYDSVQLLVVTQDSSLITWLAPLTGNATTQIIHQAGIYSCEITVCGITSILTVEVLASSVSVNLVSSATDSVCYYEQVSLTAIGDYTDITWAGLTYGGSVVQAFGGGLYSAIVTDAYGCIAEDSVMVYQYEPAIAPETINDTVCYLQQATLNANGQSVIYWFTDTSLTTVVDSGSVHVLTDVSSNSTFYTATFNGICYSQFEDVMAIVNPVSLHPAIIGDTVVCVGDTIHLNAGSISGAIYTWTSPDGNIYTSNAININSAGANDSGYYSLIISDDECSSPVDSIYVQVFQRPNPFLIGGNAVCAGSVDTLRCIGSFNSYLWIPGGQTTSQIPVSQSGNYAVTVTDINGCSATTATVHVNIIAPPAIPVINGDTILCSDEFLNLNVVPLTGITYLWDLGSSYSGGPSLSVPVSQVTSNAVTLILTSSFVCSLKVDIGIVVSTAPELTLLTNSAVCDGSDFVINCSTTAGSVVQIHDSFGNIYNADSMSFAAVQSAQYMVSASANGCTDTLNLTCSIVPYPVFDLGNDTVLCNQPPLTLSIPQGTGGYSWSSGDLSSTISINQSQTLIATVTNSPNCSTIDTIILEFIDCGFFIPNAFTPNMDGMNDVFMIPVNNARSLSLNIFNRWGQVLYNSSDLNAAWDGRIDNGQDAEAGTYFFETTFTDFNNSVHHYKGTVTLSR